MKPRFTVKDEAGSDRYFVEGKFFSLQSEMHIYNAQQQEVARIFREMFRWMPRYHLEINGQIAATIVKEFTFFKDRYHLEDTSLHIEGDYWSHEYRIYDGEHLIMQISKEWFTWGDSYMLDIRDSKYELIALGIVLAIDCVQASQNNA